MAKFSGPVGFVLPAVETSAGVWEEPVVEQKLYGDILRPARQLEGGDKVNNDLSVSNSISVVKKGFAANNFLHLRYVKWMGGYWTVTNVEVQGPRLILRLGGVYNGPKPS